MSQDNLLRAIIVDDEPLNQRYVDELVNADGRFEVVAVCGSGEAAIKACQRLTPDVMFLDIEMPSVGGFDVIDAISAGPQPLVVFVTAFDQHASRAFRYHAFDYVVKPIAPIRFAEVLNRVVDRIRENKLVSESKSTTEIDSQIASAARRCTLKTAEGQFYCQPEEIEYIESVKNYLEVWVKRERYKVRSSLELFCEALPATQFIRVHRSFVVNLAFVRKIQSRRLGSSPTLETLTGAVIPVSRRRQKVTKEAIETYVRSIK